MSVLGLGLDVVEVEGFAGQLDLAGSDFAVGTFSDAELARAEEVGRLRGGAARSRHLAGRYAAKEAFVKAWSLARAGCPPAMDEVCWPEIEVVADSRERPVLRLGGRTATAVEALGPHRAHLSISHDGPVAAAVVMLEAVVAGGLR